MDALDWKCIGCSCDVSKLHAVHRFLVPDGDKIICAWCLAPASTAEAYGPAPLPGEEKLAKLRAEMTLNGWAKDGREALRHPEAPTCRGIPTRSA